MSLRDDILAADDRPREALMIPEWNSQIYVRTMTGAQRDKIDQLFSEKRYDNIRAIVAAWSVEDEAGNRVFSEGDVLKLTEKSGAALDRIFNVWSRLNGMRPEDIDAAKKG